MGYNIVDIINKAINISSRRREVYVKIGDEKSDMHSLKIMVRVLVKEIDKTIAFYEKLKEEVGNTEFEEIDFRIYDKISFLINEFNSRIFIGDINNTREFLELTVALEKDVYSLLINIQGRLVNDTEDVKTNTYKIISDIIKYKAQHILTLEKTISK